MSAPCEHAHLIEAYRDGQLDAATMLSVESHLGRCEECREAFRFHEAMCASLRRDMATERPTESARAQWAAALLAEEHELASASPPARGRLVSWGTRSAVPLTAAAALALLWGSAAQGPLTTRASLLGAAAVDSGREVLEELVHEHSRPLPPERTDPRELREFEQYVGVPVKARVFEKQMKGARLVGGRVLPMHQERAAMLQYEVGSGDGAKRVSVLIYDPRRIQVGSAELSPRTVGTSEVRVGRARGYSVAVTEREGVGYALASDLDTEHSARFVSFTDE